MLKQILEATQSTVAMKGADEREPVIGRLLGLSALALSGRLASEVASAEEALKVGWRRDSNRHSFKKMLWPFIFPFIRDMLKLCLPPGLSCWCAQRWRRRIGGLVSDPVERA